MVIIARPLRGVSLNGNEYLLDENGEAMSFTTVQDAKNFLKQNDVSEEDIEAEIKAARAERKKRVFKILLSVL